ncbi:MAG: hypothetical protein HPY64_12870 [Anaerolineae bacterium]|nr:hypothetical protein [Anaerolineae bacterium]
MSLPLPAILTHLRLNGAPPAPTLPYLNRLLLAWAMHIPWESASRIARHQQPGAPADYARLPEAFFADALRLGTGGTCFESNLALKAVLDAIGFHSTLALCDMTTKTIEPHCALIVTLEGTRYLADVGYPIPTALPLDPDVSTSVATPVYDYHAAPVAADRWLVRRTSRQFEQISFWVNSTPVDPERFHARLLRDHAPDGLFLDEVIIQKLRGGQFWRYSEDKGLVRRTVGREEPVHLAVTAARPLPKLLSDIFGMDRRVIESALSRTPPDGVWPPDNVWT